MSGSLTGGSSSPGVADSAPEHAVRVSHRCEDPRCGAVPGALGRFTSAADVASAAAEVARCWERSRGAGQVPPGAGAEVPVAGKVPRAAAAPACLPLPALAGPALTAPTGNDPPEPPSPRKTQEHPRRTPPPTQRETPPPRNRPTPTPLPSSPESRRSSGAKVMPRTAKRPAAAEARPTSRTPAPGGPSSAGRGRGGRRWRRPCRASGPSSRCRRNGPARAGRAAAWSAPSPGTYAPSARR